MSNKNKLIVDRIVSALGVTKVSLGEKLGVSKGVVNQWRYSGIPSEYCSSLEELLKETSDPLTKTDMRPDDWHKWWPELAQTNNSEEAA